MENVYDEPKLQTTKAVVSSPYGGQPARRGSKLATATTASESQYRQCRNSALPHPLLSPCCEQKQVLRCVVGITSFKNGAKYSCSGEELVPKVVLPVRTKALSGTVSATLCFTIRCSANIAFVKHYRGMHSRRNYSPQADQSGKSGVRNASYPTSQKADKVHQFAFTMSNHSYRLLSGRNREFSSHCIVYEFYERPFIEN